MDPATYGFPPQYRLKKPADFEQVFNCPQKSADHFLTVLARKGGSGSSRLGLAISKKAIRKAVDRNRVKRLIRETFRLCRGGLGGYDYVVMARTAAAKADSQALRQSLEKHWKILQKKCNSY